MKIQIKWQDVRSMDDPYLNGKDFPDCPTVRHHFGWVKAEDFPAGIPQDVNPRSQNGTADKPIVYKRIKDSLLGETQQGDTQKCFHLRNQGIKFLVSSYEFNQNTKIATLGFDDPDRDGIPNGGHTYGIVREVIEENLKNGNLNPEESIPVEVIVGLPQELVYEVSEGLNTSVPVKQTSMADFKGNYDWLKEILSPYSKDIRWEENSDGSLDVVNIIRYLYCLNIEKFPNDSQKTAVLAYNSKTAVHNDYLKDKEQQVQHMRNLVLDICKLHDHIVLGSMKIWNNGDGKFANSSLAKVRNEKSGQEIFLKNEYKQTGDKNTHVLHGPIIYPILSAFRAFIKINPENGLAEWKHGFDKVLEMWTLHGREMLEIATVYLKNKTLTTLGKESSFWRECYGIIEKYENNLVQLQMNEIISKQAKIINRYEAVEM